MSVAQIANDALKLNSLRLPASLRVVGLEAEDYTDSDGEAALRVRVFLDESVDVENVTGEEIGELKSAIHQSLIKHGVLVFPYIFLVKQSELDETDDEE